MADLPKPSFTQYEYADAATQTAMNPLIQALENQRWSKEAVADFGTVAERALRASVTHIEKFLEDPTSPEADQEIKDRLRDEYLAAAGNMALTLGAGEEVLRRYDAEYLEQAAEELTMTHAEAEQQQIQDLIARREELAERLKVLGQPEKTHEFVCAAIGRLESGRQFSVSLARGMPLDESISVRKAPLAFAKQKAPVMR